MIRVVVVEDQELMRKGLCGLLELSADVRVVGEAADGQCALTLLRELQPDVVLLDVRMPGLDGVRVLERMNPPIPTILLTTFDDDAVLRAGARGFLLKDISRDRLLDAVRRVAAGETLILPAVTEAVVRRLARLEPKLAVEPQVEVLTRREREILRLLASGMSNREIADFLGNSEGTVKNHTSAILAKLGVRDRTRAVLRGLQLGLI